MTPTVTPTVAPPVPATPNFVNTPKPTQEPLIVTPVSNPASPPPKKSYQIALFVNSDSTSQKLRDWFTQNKQLAALKESSHGFKSTPLPMQSTRLAMPSLWPYRTVPSGSLPDATGGHIHAAGRSDVIPSTLQKNSTRICGTVTRSTSKPKQAQKTEARENQRVIPGTMRSRRRCICRLRIVRMDIARRHPPKIVAHWIESAICSMALPTLAMH